MEYLILIAAFFFILMIVYSSTSDSDYDFRNDYYRQFQQGDYPVYGQGLPYYPPQMPFNPRQWYEAEEARMRRNFNSGFKVAIVVAILIFAAYIWGRYFS